MRSKADESRFCSNACHGNWKSVNYVGKDNPAWKCGDVLLICEWCGKEYHVSRYAEDGSRFCSRECYGRWMSVNCVGEKSPAWRGGDVSKICKHCGKKYYVIPAKATRSNYCSKECMTKNMSGENSPNWQGGISFEPYCEKFNDSFKESIRDKFDRKCFICDKSESMNMHKLSVHHVSYQKDCLCGDVKCDFVPLCKTCHGMTNCNRFFWEKLLTYALQYYDEYYAIDISKPLLYMQSK